MIDVENDLLRYSRLKQLRTDEALPVSINHFKQIGAGLTLMKLCLSGFPPDETSLSG